MKYECVILDLDGTLADTLEDIADSMNTVLTGMKFPVHGYEAYTKMIGNGIKTLVIRSLPEAARTEDIIADCYEKMIFHYRNNCVIKTRLYDGVSHLVEQLKIRGYILAVLSNKADELTKKIVGNCFSPADFDVVLGSRVGIPLKPDPEAALSISRQLGIEPDKILYVGDSGVDMITANRAGMYAVGVTWGFKSREELIENGAKQIISHPLELLEIAG